MERRRFVLGSLAAGRARPQRAVAQGARARRIGWLWGVRPTTELLAGLRDGLRDLGWVEGRDFTFEHRAAEGQTDRQATLVTELLRRDIDVLVTSQTVAVRAAVAATRTLPIVMLGTGDPVRTGLVSSLARPGGQVTGLSLLVGEITVKVLGLLREVQPRLSHVALFVNPANVLVDAYVADVQAAATPLGVRVLDARVRVPEDVDQAFASVLRERADAIVLAPEPFIISQRAPIAEFGLRHR